MTMDDGARLAEALRLLQAGDAARALEIARELRGSPTAGARAEMLIGIARRQEGRLQESLYALERAASRAADDYAIAFETGLTLQALARFGPARAAFMRSGTLRATFAPAHRHAAMMSIALADFATAEQEYARASSAAPDDPALWQLLAQVQLLRGHLEAGWRSYARRVQRREWEARFSQQGVRYEVPALAHLGGRRVVVIGEQGLGDNLFFLRYAPALRHVAASLEYVGDDRLLPLLMRTGLFARMHGERASVALDGAVPVLLGDLPSLDASLAHAYPPSLAIAPSADAMQRVGERLAAAGPKPWIGVTWRAGIAPETGGLAKEAPITTLFGALRPTRATVVVLQRAPTPGELDAASAALGRSVHDFSFVNADLEDALAATALLDRHIAVSNTNVHLAAAAGASVDVLVPFPPEWRWGLDGDSPWFDGFGVHRQSVHGEWDPALERLAR
jgi:tetratricopeptide (TPR) repeat protein